MTDLIVAEKASQARTIAAVLGGKNVKLVQKKPVPVFYIRMPDGREAYVTSARGHLFTTDFEKHIRKLPWTKTDPTKLLTDAKVTKLVRDGAHAILKVIYRLAKKADRLIIATDYDREGENIGRQIVQIAKKANPRIKVKRARFSAMTPSEIRQAFAEENLTGLNMNMVNASEARQESDLRMGAAFTRTMSGAIQKRLGLNNVVISVGPVQSPTLGFIVERYLEHEESKKKAKKEYIIIAETKYGTFTLEGKKREKKEEAEKIARLLPKELELDDVEVKLIPYPPPLPLNTPRLAELAAKYLGFPSKKTLDLAERLYLKGYLSYPRTETDMRTKESLKKAFPLAKKAAEVLKAPREPGRPRSGKRNDNAHPPIHPTKVVHPSRLSGDERKLYELVLRHFLANFGPKADLEQVRVRLHAGEWKFKKDARVLKSPGRTAVYPYVSFDKFNYRSLPKRIPVIRYRVVELPPKIKPPITEAELVKLMDKHGIGTDATFAEHIAKLIERGYVKRQGKYLIPTPLGLKLYFNLKDVAEELVKPEVRAFMERTFKMVEHGQISKEEAVKMNMEKFLPILIKLRKRLPKISSELAKLALEQLEKKKKRRKK